MKWATLLVWAVAWVVATACMCNAEPTEILPLWPEGVPGNTVSEDLQTENISNGEVRYSRVCIPTLAVYMPGSSSQTTAAIVICPGGGYARLAYTHEGVWIAEKLNALGIAAAVVKYRLPEDDIMTEPEKRPLQDAQRAMQLMHQNAGRWHVDPNRIGIMGFSAGGHLAASVSTHFKDVLVPDASVDQVKPDFSILIYPVISLTPELMHKGSRDNLIGPDASEELVRYYSNELNVSADMAPVFLLHAEDDRTVKVENSLVFFEALHTKKVPAELHIIDTGGHGFGWRPNRPTNRWFGYLESFLKAHSIQ